MARYLGRSPKISISDFIFKFAGAGHYRVTYSSPTTGKSWTTIIKDMPLIDCTLHAEVAMRKDLEKLKWMCKNR